LCAIIAIVGKCKPIYLLHCFLFLREETEAVPGFDFTGGARKKKKENVVVFVE